MSGIPRTFLCTPPSGITDSKKRLPKRLLQIKSVNCLELVGVTSTPSYFVGPLPPVTRATTIGARLAFCRSIPPSRVLWRLHNLWASLISPPLTWRGKCRSVEKRAVDQRRCETSTINGFKSLVLASCRIMVASINRRNSRLHLFRDDEVLFCLGSDWPRPAVLRSGGTRREDFGETQIQVSVDED